MTEVEVAHRAYVAGPMRGYEDFNHPAFDAVAATLRMAGWSVFSPAEADQEDGLHEDWGDVDPSFRTAPKSLADYMAVDLAEVCKADAVWVLDGWEKSQGARLEVHVALEVGRNVYSAGASTWGQEITAVPPLDEPDVVGLDDAGAQLIVVDPVSGGAKGRNLLRYGLIPVEMLRALARHYGIGAFKYDDDNWRQGYAWSLSIDALERHFQAWRGGESTTVERFEKDGKAYAFETHHLIAVIWQATTLYIFERLRLGTDDRPVGLEEAA